jgi:cytochrome P450
VSTAAPPADALYPPTVPAAAGALPLLRFLATFVANPLRTIPAAAYRDGIVQITGPVPSTFVTDPALIEDVLVRRTDVFAKSDLERRVFGPSLGNGVLLADGAAWKWQRRVLAPLFRHSEILTYVPQMATAAEGMIDHWRNDAIRGPMRRIDDDMTALTFDVIARTMLSGGIGAETQALLQASSDYLDRISWEVAYALVRLPEWVWHPAKAQMRHATRVLRETAHVLIDRRRRDTTPADDLMTRLLAARDPETSNPMSDDQLIDNLLTLLEAGHETTAKTLTWTAYLLARSPAWQEKVRAEVSAIAGDRPIGPEHVDQLAVTARVIKEAMRLYPAAPVLARRARAETTLGGRPITAGARVIVPIYAVHRHEKLWHDPGRFEPDRFLPEHEAKIWRTQFMPFGAGPRICLGQSFAMVEAIVLLATLVRAARFKWDGRHLPEPVSRVTLRPKGGMPLAVTPIA